MLAVVVVVGSTTAVSVGWERTWQGALRLDEWRSTETLEGLKGAGINWVLARGLLARSDAGVPQNECVFASATIVNFNSLVI